VFLFEPGRIPPLCFLVNPVFGKTVNILPPSAPKGAGHGQKVNEKPALPLPKKSCYIMHMFAHIRYIALVCVVAGSILSGLLVRVFAGEIRVEIQGKVQEEHAVIAEAVASGLWRDYAPLTPTVVNTTTGPIMVPVDFSKFPPDAAQFLSQFNLGRIGLYAFKDGQVYPLASDVEAPFAGEVVASGANVARSPVLLIGLERIREGYAVSRGIHVIDTQKQPRRVFQSLIPIPRADAQGERVKACLQRFDPSCRPEIFVELVSDLTPTLETITFYQWAITGGAVLMFLVVGTVVFLTVGRAEGIIARQHELNLELTAAAAAAEAQSRDKSMFLANISHELRTPLNAIIGFSEIIKNEGRAAMSKQHQDYVDDIHASGKHLLALINDILDYSKAEAGKLQIEYSEADMLKLIRNCMRMVLPRAEAAQVTLVENLPKTPLVVTTDVKKLKQVLLNILSNAVKFTPAGGEVRVAVWQDIVTHDMVVEIKDTGIGISPKDISRVMMPFVQVDSTLARRFEGTGLGLPLSKKFIESLGGQFFIESEVNKGTTITARLPMKGAYGAPTESTPDEESKEA
jgi:two-component system, cell cycle sensor histidine kinase PleC